MDNNKLTSVPDLTGPYSINLLLVAIIPFLHIALFLVSRVETNLILCIPFEQQDERVSDIVNSR